MISSIAQWAFYNRNGMLLILPHLCHTAAPDLSIGLKLLGVLPSQCYLAFQSYVRQEHSSYKLTLNNYVHIKTYSLELHSQLSRIIGNLASLLVLRTTQLDNQSRNKTRTWQDLSFRLVNYGAQLYLRATFAAQKYAQVLSILRTLA